MNETVTVIPAYIDPGAAGFIIVSVLGFLAAIGYMARAYLSRIKQLVFRSAGRKAKRPRTNRTHRGRHGGL